MKLPKGLIFTFREKDNKEVILDEQDLVCCKDCIYRNTDDCAWRKDETPDDDDFCSAGED